MNDQFIEGGQRLSYIYKHSQPNLPLISVITVVLNRNKTIQRCMDSVFLQTYPNIEYIVVDGASTDGTLEKIQANGDHIDYFVSQSDAGIYDAINKGLSLSTGDYFLILNSDDWYESTAVEVLVNQALGTNADIVHADAWLVGRFGIVYDRLNGWLNDGLYTHRMPLRHETMLIKLSVHDKFGIYDTSYQVIADYEFLVRIYQGGCKFSHVKIPLLYFSMRGISNRRRDIVVTERKRLYATQFSFLDTEDLDKISNGLDNEGRRYLIKKYADKSDLFIRSLTCFVSRKPSVIARILKSLERTPGKPALIIARWIKRFPSLIYGNLVRIRIK